MTDHIFPFEDANLTCLRYDPLLVFLLMSLYWPSCLFVSSFRLSRRPGGARLISDQCSISWLTSLRLLLTGNSLLVLFVGCEHYRVSVLPGLLLPFNATGMGFSFRR